MKVVLFCGGYGMRMRDGTSDIPKPMVQVGCRPLIWHVMRYYAYYGHRDFILAMGYGAQAITSYFTSYDETASNDFVLEGGEVTVLSPDIADWRITFVNTGLNTAIGERLARVSEHLDGEEMFMANYADVLTDAPLDDVVRTFEASEAVASLLAVPPQSAFHVVATDTANRVESIHSVSSLPIRENGGYFVFRRELLERIVPGTDLVGDTLTALTAEGKVIAYPYDGFWMPADTVKERAVLEEMSRSEQAPWMKWSRGHASGPTASAGGATPSER